MPRTIKLTLAYDGTRYVGWQRQAEGVSIQGLVEEALARFEGRAITVHGAGRTDAGVHALGQVASAQLSGGHDASVLLRGLNALLPRDVRVMSVDEVADDFHARFSARSKTYRYAIRNAPVVSPFEFPFVWHVPERLDLAAMQAAAATLTGRHDFACFRSAGQEVKSTVRTISRSELIDNSQLPTPNSQAPTSNPQSPIPNPQSLLIYEVTANGFLRHMVRAIAGTLVEVGQGSRTPEAMAALLTGRSRADAGPTAPPQGLFLVSVTYD
jgi:tRNA pseudouridine38-40 synthase